MAGVEQAYFTLAEPTEAVVFRDRGSKFLAYLFPCQNQKEVEKSLAILKEKYPNATHHCFAYRLGVLGDTYRANDDGEPAGTAGLPIYNQLQSAELTQVLAVVVRFYGGTKLGSSGLVHAYKTATKMAIEQAKIIKKTPKLWGVLQFPYQMEGPVKAAIAKCKVEITDQEFAADCAWQVGIPYSKKKVWKAAISELKAVHFREDA